MKKYTVIITTEDVEELQYADAKVRSMQQVLQNFIDEHLLDKNVDFLKSAVYQKFQEMTVDAQIDFEKKKNKVADKYIPGEQKDGTTSWAINYATEELVYTVKEDTP